MSRRLLAALAVLAVGVLAASTPARARTQQHPDVNPPARWLLVFDTGPKFDPTKMLCEQAGFMEHVAAINKLSADGSLLLGGPLLESAEPHKLTGALWIVQAENEDAVRKLVAGDPFVQDGIAKLASIRYFYAGAGKWMPTDKPAAK